MLGKKILLPFVGIIIIIGIVLFMRQSVTKEYLLPSFSLAKRISYWKNSLQIIKSVPWQGLGPGNFNLTNSRYAHNSYLQIWAEMGILGIISFLWLIIAVFKAAFKNTKDSVHKNQTLGLIAANIVFLVHNLVDFSFFLPEVSLIWWAILGCLYIL